MHWLFARPAERDACRRINQLGGSFVVFGHMPFAAHVTSIYLRETNVADDDLPLVHMIPRLDSVELGYTSITDRGIAQIATHPAIRYLFLWGTQITDDCLDSLSRMQDIRR